MKAHLIETALEHAVDLYVEDSLTEELLNDDERWRCSCHYEMKSHQDKLRYIQDMQAQIKEFSSISIMTTNITSSSISMVAQSYDVVILNLMQKLNSEHDNVINVRLTHLFTHSNIWSCRQASWSDQIASAPRKIC